MCLLLFWLIKTRCLINIDGMGPEEVMVSRMCRCEKHVLLRRHDYEQEYTRYSHEWTKLSEVRNVRYGPDGSGKCLFTVAVREVESYSGENVSSGCWNALPVEIWEMISAQLPVDNYLGLRLVCKQTALAVGSVAISEMSSRQYLRLNMARQLQVEQCRRQRLEVLRGRPVAEKGGSLVEV